MIGFDLENRSSCGIYTGPGLERHMGILRTYKNTWDQPFDVMSRYESDRLEATSIRVVDNSTSRLCPCRNGEICEVLSGHFPGRCVPDINVSGYENLSLIPLGLVVVLAILGMTLIL
jgi:hypothetical protein